MAWEEWKLGRLEAITRPTGYPWVIIADALEVPPKLIED
jgi:hypothetical protein